MQTKRQAIHFLVNKQYKQLCQSLSTEYLSILAILYGDKIESGIMRVSDYGPMTMLEAENEFRIRTMMLSGQIARKQKELRAKYKADEEAMLEQLKKIS